MGGIDIDIAVCSTRSKDSWTGECQARFDIRSGGEKAYEQRQATWHLIVGADVVEAVMVSTGVDASGLRCHTYIMDKNSS